MKISLFYHSLLSDWNHGNAHFLRGVATELLERGHELKIFEPENNWSLTNLLKEHGSTAIEGFYKRYPTLTSSFYTPEGIDLEAELGDQDLVIVHEWNDHEMVKRIGELRKKRKNMRLMFHDTHHRAVSAKESMEKYDLTNYDGVLAFGEVIKHIYLDHGWAKNAWTWHEAADIRVFHPYANENKEGDLVWIGNWGDNERKKELHQFLIDPVKELGLKARIYGVNYPRAALNALEDAGIEYGGWLPNHQAPEVFAKYKVTVHVPRRPYVESLPGIPTIRPFEAMACGIPLISSPWKDAEGLFTPGKDFLVAHDKEGMKYLLQELIDNKEKAAAIAQSGLETIQKRHTCKHRVDELLSFYDEIIETQKSTHKRLEPSL